MSWRLRNIIRLRSQTGFSSFGYLRDSEDINRAWDDFKENTKTSVKDSLGLQIEAAQTMV